MAAESPLRVAVCGAGAFGRNHVRVYRELQLSGFPVTLAAIVEPDGTRAAALSAELQVPVFETPDACLAAISLDAASVCVPTSSHAEVASTLLSAGVHVLVEKPIAPTLAEADALLALAAAQGRVLQVGHLERWNPAVRALDGLLRRPMFFEAHRLSVFSPRSLDVDVVLDLMIHDLDIVLHLAGSAVREVRAVGLPVLSSQVDIANVRVEFESGCVANFTASRVSTERVRKLRFFQPHQYVSVDYARQDLLIIEVSPAAAPVASPDAATASATSPDAAPGRDAALGSLVAPNHPGLGFHKPPITAGEPLRLEITAFLESILHGTPPTVPAVEARDALALALEVQSAMQQHADRAGLASLLG